MPNSFPDDFIRVPDTDDPAWSKAGDEMLLDGRYLHVAEEQWHTPTRNEPVPWTVVHRKSAIAVVAMTEDDRILLVKQERVAPRRTLWEIVAGQIDDIDNAHDPEVIRDTIERELEEEAGYRLSEGGEIRSLGYYYTSPGFTDEHIYLFLARPVLPLPGGNAPDDSEAIVECSAFTWDELLDMVARNEIVDSLTLSASARLTAKGVFPIRNPNPSP